MIASDGAPHAEERHRPSVELLSRSPDAAYVIRASMCRSGGRRGAFARRLVLLGVVLLLILGAPLDVLALFQPTYDGGVQLKASEAAARSLGLRLQALHV